MGTAITVQIEQSLVTQALCIVNLLTWLVENKKNTCKQFLLQSFKHYINSVNFF